MQDRVGVTALLPRYADMVRWFATVLAGRAGPDDLRARRLAGMMQGIVTSLGNKALAVIISFVSVPLTVGYLGAERFGAWVVLGSALTWLGLTDFGLGHGLTNAVTTAASQDRPDLVRMHLTNFVVIMSAIALALMPIFVLIWPLVNMPDLFGVHTPGARAEVNLAVVLAFVFFLLRMPLGLSGRVYNAYQEGRIGNYWGVAGNVLGLVSLVLVTRTGGGLPLLVVAMSGSGLVLELVNTVWLFARHRPAVRPGLRHLNLREFHQIGRIGVQFFIIMSMALVTFQTDTLIIAHFLGAAAVPHYSVTYSLFNYATLPQAMLYPYLWTAYNEAIARGDIAWVRRTFKLNAFVGVAGTTLVVIALLLVCRSFINWWVGPVAVPTIPLAATIGVWVIINAFTNPIACFLAASSHLRAQIIYTGFATVTNLTLSLWLVQPFGATGVIGATVVAYLVFICGPSYLDATLLLARLERRHDRDAAS